MKHPVYHIRSTAELSKLRWCTKYHWPITSHVLTTLGGKFLEWRVGGWSSCMTETTNLVEQSLPQRPKMVYLHPLLMVDMFLFVFLGQNIDYTYLFWPTSSVLQLSSKTKSLKSWWIPMFGISNMRDDKFLTTLFRRSLADSHESGCDQVFRDSVPSTVMSLNTSHVSVSTVQLRPASNQADKYQTLWTVNLLQ